MNKARILYIESNEIHRSRLSGALRSKGYHVTDTASGLAGIRLFEKGHFDVILCNLDIPEFDGVEVLDRIRHKNSEIPFIFFSALGSVAKAKKAIEKGADQFVLKPKETDEIIIIIEQVIESKKLNITGKRKILDELKMANETLRETQAQLVQLEKMASLGSLVAGIAHEINTPIGAVRSMYDTLSRNLEKLDEIIKSEFPEEFKELSQVRSIFKSLEESHHVIRSGTERVVDIVKGLKSFARLDEAELKTVNIHEGLEDTLILIHHELKHDIQVIKEFGAIPLISCFPGQLNQVFLNLLINGKHSIKNKGIIQITTFAKDKKVHIAFKDNGIGISKENLKKIFDPGFTTKGRGMGTGLGLSICYQIIQNHRGTLKVKSEPGKGSTFTIVLPTNLEEILEKEKNQG